MSGLKKIFIIFTVALVLATVSNVWLNKVDATVEPTNTTSNTNVVDNNTNTNTNVNTNTASENNTVNNATNNTNTNTNTNNTIENTTNTNNTTDLSQVRNTLPKTGSNFVLKNTFIVIMVGAVVALVCVTIYNKK